MFPEWRFVVVKEGQARFGFYFAREALEYARAHGGTEIFSLTSGKYLMRNGDLTDYGRWIYEGGPPPGRPTEEKLKELVSPGIDLRSLRGALRFRPELLESLEAGVKKGTGKLGANIALVWTLAQRSLYASADVPVLAVRETCQNAIDSVRAAIAQRQIPRDAGRFEVTWNATERSLTVADNGRGMSQDEITGKFLVLGESGKRDASGSDVAAGGFGIAKAVILGASSSFKWTLHTRDNLVISRGRDADIEIFQAANLAGFRLTVFDVAQQYDYWWDTGGGGRRPIEDRIRETLAANDLPGITLLFNGEEIRPLFSRRGGTRIEVLGSWGDGTTGSVKAYKRSDRRGAYWVRLNGLHQFKLSSNGDLGVDVVVDLSTSVRPGDDGYPLNAGRDAFQGEARNTFRALVDTVERENVSVGDKQEDEVFDAEGEADDEVAEEIDALTRALADDPELGRLFKSKSETSTAQTAGADGAGGTQEPEDPFTPDAAGMSGDGAPAPSRPVLKTDLPDDYVLDLSSSKGKLPWLPAGLQTPEAVRTALDRAELESPFETPQDVLDALGQARKGWLTVAQLRTIAETMDRAARAVAATRKLEVPRVHVSEHKDRRGAGNPFGRLGALRVSRINYDRAKARSFRRSPRKWLPYLLLWDATLKLMMEAGDIQRLVKPGFVLEDGTIGLAQKRPDSPYAVIYIHPDRLKETVDANRERPMAIAGFLHGVAAHEVAHADGRMGSGHDQAFISAREDLGRRTAHLLPRLASLAVKLLKLPSPADETMTKLLRLEKQLASLRESRDELRSEKAKAVRALERELKSCRAEVMRLAGDSSAQARAACTGSCPPEMGGVPSAVRVPDVPAPEPAPSIRSMKLVFAVRDVLMSSPPSGIDAEYVERFFRRYHQHLARVVGERMPAGEGMA